MGSLVDNRAYFALYPGGTFSLKQTPVPLAAYSSRTVYISSFYDWDQIFNFDKNDKISFPGYILISLVITSFSYPVGSHWAWGPGKGLFINDVTS